MQFADFNAIASVGAFLVRSDAGLLLPLHRRADDARQGEKAPQRPWKRPEAWSGSAVAGAVPHLQNPPKLDRSAPRSSAEVMAMQTPQQRKNNRRLALILASVALVFGVGFRYQDRAARVLSPS